MPTSKKIGLIAGGGDLPQLVVTAARERGDQVHVFAIKGFADPNSFHVSAQAVGITEISKVLRGLKDNGCTHIVMAGYVKRPDFKTLKPDMASLKYLPNVVKAAAKGDDGLLRFLVETFAQEGFEVLAPQDICKHLLVPVGVLGKWVPKLQHEEDIAKALRIARVAGAHDIGQGAIVVDGLVLAVEAQEGTDAMLARIVDLDADIRGNLKSRRGVLAKCLKPGQENRVDLPTIGPSTVTGASKAGLAGIVLEAGRAFIIQREDVIKRADELGLFIIGKVVNKSE
ncbi:MAG TPA: DUF1009 domain-containing protein [Gammaproteobacteria bacterium]|nr:DUF1009 domain-containing protein [Gammaproteobacteria bacterium]